jgi:hypothetical protein
VQFRAPGSTGFDIPEEWWRFAGMDAFALNGARCFPVDAARVDDLVAIADIEPPQRDPGIAAFKKAKMVPILMALVAGNELPPVKACRFGSPSQYRYRLCDGFHRFYASVAVGYPMVPIAHVGSCE